MDTELRTYRVHYALGYWITVSGYLTAEGVYSPHDGLTYAHWHLVVE
jgi:hypothetical protein